MPILSQAQPLVRLTAASYEDNLSELSWIADPATIARIVFDQEGSMPNPSALSTLFVSWGQFIDHDLSLTRDASGEHVVVPGLVTDLERSVNVTDADGVRQPVNEVTSQMDASMIYGSTGERTAEVRSFEGGRLKMGTDATGGDTLPVAQPDQVMAGAGSFADLYLAGDVRANENTGLLTMHTLMAREHNTWAARLAEALPDFTDEQLFQAARSIVEAEVQHITYTEWLPLMLGAAGTAGQPQIATDLLSGDWSYDPTVSGQVSVEFSTAAFRFGHTMVTSLIARQAEDGSDTGSLTVQEAFFNSSVVANGGLADILRGQAATMAQEADAKVIDDLNMFLTGANGITGFSLAALNILRGHDHGLGTYLEVRAALLGDVDLATIAADDFSVITTDPVLQAELAQVYASVHDVDLWVGGLSEDTLPGAQTGALFAYIIADQFMRTRAADAGFGALSDLLPADLAASISQEVAQSSLRDIILRNSSIDHLQENVFIAANRMMGTDDNNDRLVGSEAEDLMMGMDGGDILRGMGGNDTLMGDKGDDRLMGGAGSDWLEGGEGNDRLMGEQGNDHLIGGSGDDTLLGGDGDDVLDGGAGDDILSGDAGADHLKGGDGIDFLMGGAGDDLMDGGADADRMDGGDGADRMFGGAGDDWMMGDIGADTMVGGDGDDLLYGAMGEDNLFGGDGDDHLMGQYGMDQLDGGAGNDTLWCGLSNDIAFGGAGNDTIYGGRGLDSLSGDDGDDVLYGEGGFDILFGGAGNDRLMGGDGFDTLNGGTGDDFLIGEGGRDTFVFSADFGNDIVFDFEIQADTIDLSALGLESFDQVQSALDQQGSDVLIDLGSHGTVMLRDIDATNLNSDHFMLADPVIDQLF